MLKNEIRKNEAMNIKVLNKVSYLLFLVHLPKKGIIREEMPAKTARIQRRKT